MNNQPQISLRNLILNWQLITEPGEEHTLEEADAKLEELYTSMSYYGPLMPDYMVPAPAYEE